MPHVRANKSKHLQYQRTWPFELVLPTFDTNFGLAQCLSKLNLNIYLKHKSISVMKIVLLSCIWKIIFQIKCNFSYVVRHVRESLKNRHFERWRTKLVINQPNKDLL